MKKVWQLDWRDKSIHRNMALAKTQVRKVARLLEEYKADDPSWAAVADELTETGRIIEKLQESLRDL